MSAEGGGENQPRLEEKNTQEEDKNEKYVDFFEKGGPKGIFSLKSKT